MTRENDFADRDWVLGIFIEDAKFPAKKTDASIRVISPDILDNGNAADNCFCFADSSLLSSVLLQIS